MVCERTDEPPSKMSSNANGGSAKQRLFVSLFDLQTFVLMTADGELPNVLEEMAKKCVKQWNADNSHPHRKGERVSSPVELVLNEKKFSHGTHGEQTSKMLLILSADDFTAKVQDRATARCSIANLTVKFKLESTMFLSTLTRETNPDGGYDIYGMSLPYPVFRDMINSLAFQSFCTECRLFVDREGEAKDYEPLYRKHLTDEGRAKLKEEDRVLADLGVRDNYPEGDEEAEGDEDYEGEEKSIFEDDDDEDYDETKKSKENIAPGGASAKPEVSKSDKNGKRKSEMPDSHAPDSKKKASPTTNTE